jgi:hypothetical protein
MQAIFSIAYLLIGLAQLFAIQDWFVRSMDWGGFFSFIAALFVTYIPLVGSVLGVLGAHDAWGWSWIASLLLFFWYVPLIGLFVLFDKR